MARGWGKFEYEQHLAKQYKETPRAGACDDESVLQAEIRRDVDRSGWTCFWSRMDKKTRNKVGTLDFTIAMDRGRTWWVEAKSKDGKVSEAQAANIAWLRKLGHHVSVVSSMTEYFQQKPK